jgi:hypothetical protein
MGCKSPFGLHSAVPVARLDHGAVSICFGHRTNRGLCTAVPDSLFRRPVLRTEVRNPVKSGKGQRLIELPQNAIAGCGCGDLRKTDKENRRHP